MYVYKSVFLVYFSASFSHHLYNWKDVLLLCLYGCEVKIKDLIDFTVIAHKIQKFVKKEGNLLSACVVPHTPTSLPSHLSPLLASLRTYRAHGYGVIYSSLTFVSSPCPSFSITTPSFLFFLPPSYLVLVAPSTFLSIFLRRVGECVGLRVKAANQGESSTFGLAKFGLKKSS